MTMYPFNEHRVQVDANHCPAPWCGRDLWRCRVWLTAVMFESDFRVLFSEVAARDPSDFKGYQIVTCNDAACRQWARLRADDLRGGPAVDPVYVAYLWMEHPHPVPPEEMQRERFERYLRESIDRIQDSLRRRPRA